MNLRTKAYRARDEMFGSAHLIAEDFDGTTALTSEPSPGGIGVIEAYDIAIEETFGTKALDYYLATGGLSNRAPQEVVKQLAPDANGRELRDLNMKLVDAKLAVLLNEVGSVFPDGRVWPRPIDGYSQFREQLEAVRADGQIIDEAILSSGHRAFIEKTYKVWGLSRPNILVSVETMELLAGSRPIEDRVKPSALIMDIARTMWRSDYRLSTRAASCASEQERIIYIGDDEARDGGLAANSGVEFMLLNADNPAETWQNLAARIGSIATEGLSQSA